MSDAATMNGASARTEDGYTLRMRDLCEATGLDRQAVHFYIQQGLLPPGRKTGRNMAWYTHAHVERLDLIKRLQQERFLPLKAIKALLDGRDAESFTVEQQAFLQSLKGNLDPDLQSEGDRHAMEDADAICERTGVDRTDVDRAVVLGLVAAQRDADGRLRIAAADAWSFECLGAMRRLGFSAELGFVIDDMLFYQEAVDTMFRKELGLIASRLASLPAAEVAPMIEQALPLIHAFLARFHTARVREFFDSLGDAPLDTAPSPPLPTRRSTRRAALEHPSEVAP